LYALRASEQQISSEATGSTFSAISGDQLRAHLIPVAPRAEQDRIVAEIEKQFTRLDDAVAALKRVQANLKRYRASVLKAACEGRLVPTEAELARKEGRSYEPASELLKRILAERRAKWETDQLQKMIAAGKTPKDDEWRRKYIEPFVPEESELNDLPKGWTWASLDQLSLKITDGEHISPKTVEAGVYLLSAKDVRDEGISLSDAKFVTGEDASRFRSRCDPQFGDILIVSRGATIGRISLATFMKCFV
jgi:type I restriction enzyme S subunit